MRLVSTRFFIEISVECKEIGAGCGEVSEDYERINIKMALCCMVQEHIFLNDFPGFFSDLS